MSTWIPRANVHVDLYFTLKIIVRSWDESDHLRQDNHTNRMFLSLTTEIKTMNFNTTL